MLRSNKESSLKTIRKNSLYDLTPPCKPSVIDAPNFKSRSTFVKISIERFFEKVSLKYFKKRANETLYSAQNPFLRRTSRYRCQEHVITTAWLPVTTAWLKLPGYHSQVTTARLPLPGYHCHVTTARLPLPV